MAISSDHQIHHVYVSEQDIPIRVREEIYENQRWYPVKGFCNHLLPTDRPPFSNKDGTENRDKALIKLPSDWVWEGDWQIENTFESPLLSSEGWTYAIDFTASYEAENSRYTFVRRRKIFRYRRYIGIDNLRLTSDNKQDGCNAETTEKNDNANSAATDDKDPSTGMSADTKKNLKIAAIVGGVALGTTVAAVGAVVAAPFVLGAAGFTTAGVAAGSLAAAIQSSIGSVAAGSLFAACQSAGAVGLTAGAAAAVGATGGAVGAGVAGVTAGIVLSRSEKSETKETQTETEELETYSKLTSEVDNDASVEHGIGDNCETNENKCSRSTQTDRSIYTLD